MAEEPSQQWRSVFQREVVRALNACRSAQVHVNNVAEALQSPSEALVPRLLRAAENMTRASQYLSQALAGMGAADLLARRGCGPVPAEPVASTQRLHDEGGRHDEWLALFRLEGAREHGQDALRWLEDCRGRLWTLGCILGAGGLLPGAPRPAPFPGRSLEARIRDVAAYLGPVYGSTLNMRALVSFAAEPVARIQVS